MNASDSNDVPLSDVAAKRRDAILADALHAADQRRRARVMHHVAGVASVCCLLAVGTLAVVSRSPRGPVQPGQLATTGPTSSPAPAPVPASATNPDAPLVVVQIIPAERIERNWQVINDDQLIAALADAGKPGGVARLNGRAVVVPLQ